jgi:hypothetical protein
MGGSVVREEVGGGGGGRGGREPILTSKLLYKD